MDTLKEAAAAGGLTVAFALSGLAVLGWQVPNLFGAATLALASGAVAVGALSALDWLRAD